MEKICKDFTGMKVSAIKNEVRAMLVADFMEFLSQKYETVAQVSNTEVAVVLGTITDEDGFTQDVVGGVKASAKSFYDKKDGLKREVHKFDIFDEAEAYDKEMKAKAAKRKSAKEIV